MIRRMYLIACAAILLIVLPAAGAPGTANAEGGPDFRLEMTQLADSGNYQVVVTAKNLVDAYAYELNFAYDTSILKLAESANDLNGFKAPVEKENRLIYAFTKIGKAAGLSGDVKLATLTFRRIGQGDADMTLSAVNLVDSELVKNSYAVDRTISTAEVDLPALFKDIAGHWAEAAIRSAATLGFVNGYPDGTFRPQLSVTRAEFAAMLIRALGVKGDGGPDGGFIDEAAIPAWARLSVEATVAARIMQGYEDRTFRAGREITRTEMTAMLVRALGIEPEANARSSFADAEQIPSWAGSYAAAAAEHGLIRGRGGNRFAPNEFATRAEAVKAVLNVLAQ
ncbi:S-layer homology domain-containing protein [Paenibacillus sp. HB172176]|uniref:S-layer homology domain-containing protein n=1 Tax=Paenibacillus sp. HB172176 TaxID=2493690 RepID=UPI00143B5B1A|nr:S-layer homology domain-containing protein [Paenibacillus sp. HB172176]